MARIKIFSMQKDEEERLVNFLNHYKKLVKHPSDITIFDNGSTRELTCAILAQAELEGVTVIRDFSRFEDFRNKGNIIADHIRHVDLTGECYDFALPVDCDELLAVFTKDKMSIDPVDIDAHFNELKGHHGAFRIDISLFNHPVHKNFYHPERYFYKGFIKSGTVKDIDLGFHVPTSRLEPGYLSTSFVYLHYHHTTYQQWRALAKNKVRQWVNPDDEKALAAFIADPSRGETGAYAIKCLQMSEDDYNCQYDDKPQLVFYTDLDVIWVSTPNGQRVRWNGQAYNQRHLDVKAYYPGALMHYLRQGYYENRALS